MPNKQTPEEWLRSTTETLTDDAAKADVIKAHIDALSETERVRIKEHEETERAKATDRGRNDARSMVWSLAIAGLVLLGFSASIATCEVSGNRKAIEVERIHGEHPGAFPSATAIEQPRRF